MFNTIAVHFFCVRVCAIISVTQTKPKTKSNVTFPPTHPLLSARVKDSACHSVKVDVDGCRRWRLTGGAACGRCSA